MTTPLYPYVETKVGSWAMDHENHDMLYATSQPMLLTGDESIDGLPDLDKESWMPIEDQSSQGACRGHSLSTCIEDCVARVGGQHIQLSRACAYYETQRIDGIRGDSGSTIEGGCRLAENDGICLESDWPYPSSYQNRRPQGFDQTKRFKTGGHVVLDSPERAVLHCAKIGPVDIGIAWYDGIDQQVSQTGIVSKYNPPARSGGHAIAIIQHRKTHFDGRDLGAVHLVINNSWSPRWGAKGRCLVTLDAFRAMLRHQMNVVVGHKPAASYPIDTNPFK
jgi:C1A family cysteine protease